MLKLFIKRVKQINLYIIGPDTDYANFTFCCVTSMDIFIETPLKKSVSIKVWDLQ